MDHGVPKSVPNQTWAGGRQSRKPSGLESGQALMRCGCCWVLGLPLSQAFGGRAQSVRSQDTVHGGPQVGRA